MDMYHLELLERTQALQQQGEGSGFGALTVRVYFNHDCVFVEIIKARDVIPLDSNGADEKKKLSKILWKAGHS